MDRVTVTLEGADALRLRLEALGREAPRAVTRALNRALAIAQTTTTRELAEDTGLRQAIIRRSLLAERATFRRQEASLRVSGRRIPLLAFGARGPEPSRGRGQGVTYRLPGGRGRHPHAFIGTMRSGHRGVFLRRTRRRLPIIELFGPSLPGVVRRRRIFELIRPRLEAALATELDRQITVLADHGRLEATDAA